MEHTAKITKWGNGQGIRLPKTFLEVLGLEVGDDLSLECKKNEIVITKRKQKIVPKKVTIQELFKDYHGDTHDEDYWGDMKPVGKEVI